jgi:hypothetical protein
MRRIFIGVGLVLAAVLSLSFSARSQTTRPRARAAAPSAADAAAKALPFDPHDLSGVWLLKTPYAGISNQHPPFTEWGQSKYDANKPSYGPKAVPPAQGNDPIGTCDPTGFPRNMFSPSRPVQFIQLPNQLLQIFQYHSVRRTIWTDGRPIPKDLDPSWYGYSVGKWDGDTFVVTTGGLREQTWLDHFGDPHSEDMTVEERYHRVDYDTFELVLTVNDPKTYSKPWVSPTKIFKLTPEQALEEEYCVPSEEDFYNKFMRDPAGGKDDQ